MVVVAQVFFLAIGRPRRIGVGQVVVGARRLRFERTRRPHAGERPPVEIRRRRDRDRFAGRQRDDVLPLEKRRQLVELLARDVRPARRAPDDPPWCAPRSSSGSPPFMRPAIDRNSSWVSFSSRVATASSRSSGIVMPSSSLQLLLELLAAETERRRAPAARASVSRYCRYAPTACDASACASARSPSRCRSSTEANAFGRSSSMNLSAPRIVSRPTLTKMPGGSVMLSRAAWISRGV